MTSTKHRHSGPKSTQYNELETMINQFHGMLRNKRHEHASKFTGNIRKFILLNGCPEDDIHSWTKKEDKNIQHNNKKNREEFITRIGHQLPTIRHVEDTIRGKLWRLTLGVGSLNSNDYKKLIGKAESKKNYVKIRGDTKRTFLTSKEYNSRVSEERLVRVLNSFVVCYNKPYCQGMDAIAAGLLYVMPELDAFTTYSLLMNKHFPTYFISDKSRKTDLIGAYAASYLSWDILKVCDREIFNHLFILPPHMYLFPLVGVFQAISQPFTQLLKLWDFLFCFGVHLNPVLAAAQIISNKKLIMTQPPMKLVQTILSQRKWMNQRLNAKLVINSAMQMIILLKQEKHKKLWQNILLHSNNFEIAVQIKMAHEHGVAISFDPSNHNGDNKKTKTKSEENFSNFIVGINVEEHGNDNDDNGDGETKQDQ
eukprot:68377_1